MGSSRGSGGNRPTRSQAPLPPDAPRDQTSGDMPWYSNVGENEGSRAPATTHPRLRSQRQVCGIDARRPIPVSPTAKYANTATHASDRPRCHGSPASEGRRSRTQKTAHNHSMSPGSPCSTTSRAYSFSRPSTRSKGFTRSEKKNGTFVPPLARPVPNGYSSISSKNLEFTLPRNRSET